MGLDILSDLQRYMIPKTIDRFWIKVDKNGPIQPSMTTPCWLWTACSMSGYGRFALGPRVERHAIGSHRFAYELLVGPIPEGLVIDHLCRVPLCVNPDHLEPVTNKENGLRGLGPPAINARKTECNKGHPFSVENTFTRKSSGERRCRECSRENWRKWDRRRRAK